MMSFCGQDSNYVCFSKRSLGVVLETVWLIYVCPGLVYRTISGWAQIKVASNQTLSEIWVSGWRVEERIVLLSTIKACHHLNLWWPLRLGFIAGSLQRSSVSDSQDTFFGWSTVLIKRWCLKCKVYSRLPGEEATMCCSSPHYLISNVWLN